MQSSLADTSTQPARDKQFYKDAYTKTKAELKEADKKHHGRYALEGSRMPEAHGRTFWQSGNRASVTGKPRRSDDTLRQGQRTRASLESGEGRVASEPPGP